MTELIKPAQSVPDVKEADFIAWLKKNPLQSNWQLATAEILYRLPDHPRVLQTYIWQDYDLAPKFPSFKNFLDFWQDNLEGKLFSVRIVSTSLIERAFSRVYGHNVMSLN